MAICTSFVIPHLSHLNWGALRSFHLLARGPQPHSVTWRTKSGDLEQELCGWPGCTQEKCWLKKRRVSSHDDLWNSSSVSGEVYCRLWKNDWLSQKSAVLEKEKSTFSHFVLPRNILGIFIWVLGYLNFSIYWKSVKPIVEYLIWVSWSASIVAIDVCVCVCVGGWRES